MSKENTNPEEKVGTDTGAHDLTTEEKLENLARNVFMLMEKLKDMGTALDNVYIQVATLIEVLAEKEDILNPEIWENKLKEVTQNIRDTIASMVSQNIRDTMEAMANEEGNNGQGNVTDPDGPDANKGSGKIIVPDNRIIIPGQ